MKHQTVHAALLLVALVCATDADAQSYSAILECKTDGQPQPSLIKIAGTESAPSWQWWINDERRWGNNMCGKSSESFGFTLAYTCRFSPGAYSYSFDVTSVPGKPEDNISSSVPRVDRLTGAYVQTRRAYERGQTLDGETTAGSCRKASEPTVPKALL